jgi:hypothetical protein
MHTVLNVLAFEAATPAGLQVRYGTGGVGVGAVPASDPPPPQAASKDTTMSDKRGGDKREKDMGSVRFMLRKYR